MSIVKQKFRTVTPSTTASDMESSIRLPESPAVSHEQTESGSRCRPQHIVVPALSSPHIPPPTHRYSSSNSSSDGLFYRHRPSPETKWSSPSNTSLSPTNYKLPTSPTASLKGGSRQKKMTLFAALLLIVSASVTLSFSFYLFLYQAQEYDAPPRNHFPDLSSTRASKQKNVSKKYKDKPRTTYWDANHGFKSQALYPRTLKVEPSVPAGQEAVAQDDYHEFKHKDTDCVPQSDWQTSSFPNCNMMHELELQAAGSHVGKHHSVDYEDNIMYMGRGWFRAAWQVDLRAANETVVLKTLRSEREFYSEFYELHRRDAVAMERLTFSPFVMDIYGFCGQSAINEMASFGHGSLTSLEKFNRKLRGKESKQAYFIKLQVATSVAVGVAHVHQVNGADAIPSMVHYDLNPRNIAIVKGGKPKLNDFNTAEFLRINPKTNETCGFPSRLHEPWWRAPEEVIKPPKGEVRLVNEKVDVYSLGSILFHILTTHSPRGKMKAERMDMIRQEVANGQAPELTEYYSKSKDPAVIAIVKAMKLCHVVDPKKRASATEVAEILLDALMEIRKTDPGRTKLS